MRNSRLLKKVIVFGIKLIGYIIYKISCVVPRNKKKWLLGDIMGFSGNTKYYLPELLEKNKEFGYNIIWITHDRDLIFSISKMGVKVYYWLAPKAIYHCLTAGVYMVTDCTKDINPYLSGKAYYVTLWHGVGLKGVGRLSKIYKSVADRKRNNFYYRVLFFYWIYRKPDLCLTTSYFQMKNFFMPMFDLSEEHFLLGMYPRNQIFFQPSVEIKSFVERYCLKEQSLFMETLHSYKKIYIYMPTWRDDGRNFIEYSGIDFAVLSEALAKKNALFILKFHSKTNLDIRLLKSFSNIVLMDKRFDVYPILPFTDCLITDYSSIYSDYLLLDKEIIIFDFDKDEYMSKDRELLFDFDEYTLATRAHDFKELLNLINYNVDCHISNEDKKRMMDIYWGARNSSLDIFEEIRHRIFNVTI
ncbi:CDP-glycerol glycerophosphotransferase family protein [Phocaeicola sp.]